MHKQTRRLTMGLLVLAFAAAALPVSPVAASSSTVSATATVRQRVALTLASSAVADPGAASTQTNVASDMTSEWVHGEDGSTLLITVVPAP